MGEGKALKMLMLSLYSPLLAHRKYESSVAGASAVMSDKSSANSQWDSRMESSLSASDRVCNRLPNSLWLVVSLATRIKSK